MLNAAYFSPKSMIQDAERGSGAKAFRMVKLFTKRVFQVRLLGLPLLFLGLSTLSPCHLPLGFIELLSIRFNCSYRLMCFTRTIDLENCFIRVGQGGKAGRSSGHVTSYFAWAPLAPLPLTSDISTFFQIPMSFLLKVLKDCRFRSSTDRIHFQSGTDCLSFKSRQDCCMSHQYIGLPEHRCQRFLIRS